MNADLSVAEDAEAILESDDCAVVEAEQVADQAARTGVAVERTGEAMRNARRTLELRQAQGGRQRDQGEIGLRRLEHRVVFALRERASRNARAQDERREERNTQTSHCRSFTQVRCRAMLCVFRRNQAEPRGRFTRAVKRYCQRNKTRCSSELSVKALIADS